MKRELRYERYYPHPPARVWRALTERSALAAWYMENDFVPVVGHKFEFRTDPAPGFNGILSCEVLLVDAPRQLAYSFIGGWMQRVTTVTWTLVPQADGTLVILEHTGFTELSDAAVRTILDSGWQKFLLNLPGVLDSLAADAAPQTN